MENLYHHIKKKPSKYRNVKVEIDGYIFDSKGESNRYQSLRLLEKAGEIEGIKVHPRYPIIVDGEPLKIRSSGYPNGRIVIVELDFEYTHCKTKELISEDWKGMDTSLSRLKRALFEAVYKRKVNVLRWGQG